MKQLWQLLTLLILILAASPSCSSDPVPQQASSPAAGGTGIVAGCATGQTDCGSGVCVDLLTHPANCGACGNVCPAGTTCTQGVCACQGGLSDCAGVCTDLASDASNCGVCGTACPLGQTCSAGACTCTTGTACTGGCVDLSTNAANCGGCDTVCQNTQLCSAGSCQCQAGFMACGDACVSTISDPNNCGGCGVVCQATEVCSQGVCSAACADGETNCERACVDVSTNRENCGACGVACASERDCSAGTCNCPAGTSDCAGACVDTNSDASNCGTCGVTCMVGQTCQGGTCVCPDGQQLCDGECVSTASNPSHCGGCNIVCDGGRVCNASMCSCAAGQELCDGSCVTQGTCDTSTGSGGSGAGGTGGSGAGGTGGSGGGGGTTSSGNCTFTVNSSLSSAISTVGIVEWSTDLSGLSSANIEFGLSTDYGMTAPVDLNEANNRTLLLGMKPSHDYHFRIVANGTSEQCTSGDYTLTTGTVPNGVLPDITISTQQPEALAPGFTMTGQYSSGGGGSPAYVFDQDGDFVWWYRTSRDVTCARMSWDGKWMYITAANVPEQQGANVHRVSMDGLTDQDLTGPFTGQNHTLTVLPDETVAFFAYGSNGCDDVKLYNPSNGQVTTVINAADAHGAGTPCHLNGIEYSPDDDSLVFSDLDHNNLTKVTRSGNVVWVLGGTTSDFSGNGASWDRQHGLNVLAPDRILFFNNGGLGSGGGGSLALEVLLDLNNMTASIAWQYAASPSISNQVMGDVQRLPNGNTVVSYATQGVMHEVDAGGALVQSLQWALGGAFGYVTKRPTLYGPPPK